MPGAELVRMSRRRFHVQLTLDSLSRFQATPLDRAGVPTP